MAQAGTGHADLYSLVHREYGPISTSETRTKAEEDLAAVLADEPGWEPDLSVEVFQVRDAEANERA